MVTITSQTSTLLRSGNLHVRLYSKSVPPSRIRLPLRRTFQPKIKMASLSEISNSAVTTISHVLKSDPSGWSTSLLTTSLIFAVGSPILVSGLTPSGVLAAFALGSLTWKSFGPYGFLIVSLYFVLGTAATKVKLKQKQKEGIAEQRGGRRGPASVIGSSAAAVFCALLAALPIPALQTNNVQSLLQLGFLANFCTKLSDTSASEIGKAFGKTTYLVTTFELVPRGTEGAVSVEGTVAGLVAAILLATVGLLTGQCDIAGFSCCILSSQFANFVESWLGATLQGRPGYEWISNDVANVINISIGTVLSILLRFLLPL